MLIGCIEWFASSPGGCCLFRKPKRAYLSQFEGKPMQNCKNRKSEKLPKVSRVVAGSPQNRSGGIGSDVGVSRVFDTFHNSKRPACWAFTTPLTGISRLWVWTRNEL